MTNIIRLYKKLNDHSPFWTSTISAGVLYYIGDYITQTIDIIRAKDKFVQYDNFRANSTGLFGLCLIGPFGFYFYKYADKLIPGKSMKAVLGKVGAGLAFFSPVYIPIFFIYQDWRQKKSWEQTQLTLKQRVIETYLADLVYWIPAEIINFRFINPKYRILYMSVMSIGWSAFLSFQQHKQDPKMSPLIHNITGDSNQMSEISKHSPKQKDDMSETNYLLDEVKKKV